MADLVVIVAPLSAQKRLADEELARMVESGYKLDRRYETTSWQQLMEESQSGGLFASKRIFMVDDGASLGPVPADWQKRFEEQDETAILLLYEKSPQKDLGKKVMARCRLVKHQPAPTWPSRRSEWLMTQARGVGLRLEREAAALLVDWIDDEEELRAELVKFKSVVSEAAITTDHVVRLSNNEGNRAMLSLLDALAAADLAGVRQSMTGLRLRGELIPTLSAVHKRLRAAWYGTWLGDDLQDALGLTDYQLKVARSTARRWRSDVLGRLTGEVARLSLAERTGDGQGWSGLEVALLTALAADT